MGGESWGAEQFDRICRKPVLGDLHALFGLPVGRIVSELPTNRSHAESSGEFYVAQGFDRLWSRRKPTTVEHT